MQAQPLSNFGFQFQGFLPVLHTPLWLDGSTAVFNVALSVFKKNGPNEGGFGRLDSDPESLTRPISSRFAKPDDSDLSPLILRCATVT